MDLSQGGDLVDLSLPWILRITKAQNILHDERKVFTSHNVRSGRPSRIGMSTKWGATKDGGLKPSKAKLTHLVNCKFVTFGRT